MARRRARWGDMPTLPGIFYRVCGVKAKAPDGAILASYDEETRAFVTRQVEPGADG